MTYTETPHDRLMRLAREMNANARADDGLNESAKELANTAMVVSQMIFREDLTMAGYLMEMVSAWRTAWSRGISFPICEFIGMSPDEYADWVMNDVVPYRVGRAHLHGYIARITRGHR